MRGGLPTIHQLGRDLLETSPARRAFALLAPVLSTAAYFACALHGHWVAATLSVVFLSFITYV